jgi:broad specificity phosphatase PhoE
VDIALARHGPLALAHEPWVAPRDLGGWIFRYQSTGIVASEPPRDIQARAASSTLVCSTAARCLESARRIAAGRQILSEAIYCEADLPHSFWSHPRLPPPLWAAAFRAAWLLGYSANAESRLAATARAGIAAQQLVALARSSGPVLLIGHGIMNRLIGKQLRALGCRGPANPSSGHWRFSLYEMR